MPSENTGSAAQAGRTMPELLGAAITEFTSLFRKEVQLARAEMGEKMQQVTGAVTPMALGGGLLFGALVVLLFAAVSLLVEVVGIQEGWARLIVGAAAAVVGYLLLRGAVSRLSATSLVPERTAGQLSRDARVVKEQVQ
jgi:hypothetical protein